MEKKKLLIVTTSFSLGGITSFIKSLIYYLIDEYTISVAYTDDEIDFVNTCKLVNFIKYSKPSNKKVAIECIKHGYIIDLFKVKFRKKRTISKMKNVQHINYMSAQHTNLDIIKKEQYDMIIASGEFYCTYLTYLNFNKSKKICWFHPDISMLNIDVIFEKKILKDYKAIIAVSEECKVSLINKFSEYKSKIHCINNFMIKDEIINKGEIDLSSNDILAFNNEDCLKLLSVGRLDNSSKRFDRCIETAVLIKKEGIKFKWYLIGAGKDMHYYKTLIIEYNLQDDFILLGKKTNPYPYMKAADYLVVSSQYEGKPVVVDEAFILKCPVIASEYKSSREQIPASFGAIIPNDDILFKKELLKILKDQEKLDYFKRNLAMYNYQCQDISKLKELFAYILES